MKRSILSTVIGGLCAAQTTFWEEDIDLSCCYKMLKTSYKAPYSDLPKKVIRAPPGMKANLALLKETDGTESLQVTIDANWEFKVQDISGFDDIYFAVAWTFQNPFNNEWEIGIGSA